jgi:hypothetical protein
MAPVLRSAYAVLTWRPAIAELALLSMFFAVPTAGFALAYIG